MAICFVADLAGGNGLMATWVVWGISVGVTALLGFVGYHFSVRTLRAIAGVIAVVLALAVTAYGLMHTAPTPADLESSFALGADKVGTALFQPLWLGNKVPEPGRVGWVIIAVALLFGYRTLEVWALHWQAPQLDTSKLSEGQPSIKPDGVPAVLVDGLTDGQRQRQLAAALKFRLAAMEVRAPAILPGGSRSGGLATIAEASGVSGAGLAGAIIRFFAMLWPNPRQVQLRVWVEPAAKNARTRTTTVTVDLDDPRTGATITSKTLAAATIDEAATRVAGYVARQIFGMDPATPPWCVGVSDGSDLSALLRSRQERVPIRTPQQMEITRSDQIKLLNSVAGSSRCAGVVRYELAQLYSIRGNPYEEHLTALRLHAVNREQYPRFYRGRYRLCMSLEMIANPRFRFTNRDAVEDELNEILAILRRCRLTERRRYGDGDILTAARDGKSWKLSPELRLELLKAAQTELRGVRRQLTFWRMVWAAFLHRNERAIWQLYFFHPRLRQSFHDAACVAELLVAVRRRQNEERLKKETPKEGLPEPSKPEVSWRSLPPPTPRQLRLGVHIASALAGNDKLLWAIVTEPPGQWPPPPPSTDKPAPEDSRDRLRWLPWLQRTASWQAAYNTACLYAALASESLPWEDDRIPAEPPIPAEGPARAQAHAREAWADRVVLSLQRAVNNAHSEMERGSDWISHDPDFATLKAARKEFPGFDRFLGDQQRLDYRDFDPSRLHIGHHQPVA